MPSASPPAVTPFAFEGHPLRVVDQDGKPWFSLPDLCRALGLKNPTVAAKALAADERAKFDLGGQETTFASEGGLWTLVLRCRDAVKKGSVPYRLRRWITDEVLPSIRKTGTYGQQPQFAIPSTLADALQLAADLAKSNEKQAGQIAHLTPKAMALERIAGTRGSMNIRESAKLLGVKEQELISDLKARRIIYRREGQRSWLGFADKEAAGLVEHKLSTVERRDGTGMQVTQVRLTTKLLTRIAEERFGVQPVLLA